MKKQSKKGKSSKTKAVSEPEPHSVLDGIDMSKLENLALARSAILKKSDSLESQMLILQKGYDARVAGLNSESELLQKDTEAYTEAVMGFTEIKKVYGEENTGKIAILYTLGTDNNVYYGQLDLEKGVYLKHNETTNWPSDIIKKGEMTPQMLKILESELPSDYIEHTNVYFVTNPTGELGAVAYEQKAVDLLLERFYKENPGVKERHEAKEKAKQALNQTILGSLFGELLAGSGERAESHAISHIEFFESDMREGPDGAIPRAIYLTECIDCNMKKKCDNYKKAEKVYSRGHDISEEAAAGLAALFN